MRFSLLAVAACLLSLTARASFTGITVETTATSEFGTTYRFYANFDSPTDELIAVYGEQSVSLNAPLQVMTSTTFYQDPLGVFLGQSINELFFSAVPSMAYDSWFTIGSANSNGTGGVASLGFEPFLSGFNSGDGFIVNNQNGASWYIVPGSSADALAGDDGKVLIAQLTTTGVMSLVWNIQYRDAANTTFNEEGLEMTWPQLESGCMDEGACNYSSTAEVDDGSCFAIGDACDDGNDNTTGDLVDASCNCVGELIVQGCMDPTACNYNPDANTSGICLGVGDACDDGDPGTVNDVFGADCVCAGEVAVSGCDDPEGCNYVPNANQLEVCYYPNTPCDDGDPNTINDMYSADCDCAGTLYIEGCTDDTACNYVAEATDDDGSCTYAAPGEDCAGVCLSDVNDNGVCDDLEVFGCTAETADNYNAEATTDNGSCTWAGGLIEGLSYEVYAEDGITGYTTYRVFADFSSAALEVVAAFGYDTAPWTISSTGDIYQDATGGDYAADLNPAFFAFVPSMEFDTWLALGAAPGETDNSTSLGMEDFMLDFNATDVLNVNTFTGGSVYLVPGLSSQSVPVDGRVLLGQITSDGVVSVNWNIQIRDFDLVTYQGTGMELTFPEVNTGLGCTDPLADNYDPDATFDDGSCEYPEPSYTGLTYELVAEDMPTAGLRTYRVYANFDNPDDQLTAVFAQEGDPMSITTTTSFYQNALGGAFANEVSPTALLVDPDVAYDSWFTIGGEDSQVNLTTVGVEVAATSFEAGGDFAINNALGGSWFVLPGLEPLAYPDADGRVLIAQLTTDGVVNLSVNLQYRAENGTNPQEIEQTLEFPVVVQGCTDVNACNYDFEAEVNDGSCVYPLPFRDCFGDCLMDADGDGICDEQEIPGCTDAGAANYNAEATDDDGSCEFPGCTEVEACNYDASANTNDGSCLFPELYYDCDGNCLNDSDGDGVCDELEIPGCTDQGASNFDASATDDDGSCEYLGCTNPNADNFDSTANVDDGSCIVGGCGYANATNYDAATTYDDGSCVWEGCTDEGAANYNPLASTDDGSCVDAVLGCTYGDALNFNAAATTDDGSCTFDCVSSCPFDVDGNGSIGSADLIEFLATYGTDCPE